MPGRDPSENLHSISDGHADRCGDGLDRDSQNTAPRRPASHYDDPRICVVDSGIEHADSTDGLLNGSAHDIDGLCHRTPVSSSGWVLHGRIGGFGILPPYLSEIACINRPRAN